MDVTRKSARKWIDSLSLRVQQALFAAAGAGFGASASVHWAPASTCPAWAQGVSCRSAKAMPRRSLPGAGASQPAGSGAAHATACRGGQASVPAPPVMRTPSRVSSQVKS